jgi:cytochrome c peroxidase
VVVFTNNPNDNYKFKVPQLYNLVDVAFFGHGGSFASVRDVIAYKNNANKENTNMPPGALSNKFAPLGLNEEEIDLIAEFIEKSLYDSNLQRYNPTVLPTGLCFPNADEVSRRDTGCN